MLLRSLSPAEWQRGGIHLSRGRLTLADWVARLAAHDDNHVAQLHRALEGRAEVSGLATAQTKLNSA